MTYLSFSACLTSLSTIFSGSIHAALHTGIFPFFIFAHLLTPIIRWWALGLFLCLGHGEERYLLNLEFSSFLNICPGVGLLDHMVALFLVVKGSAILFSIVAAPIYMPTNLRLGFPGGTSDKETSRQCRRHKSLIPGLGMSLGGGHGSPLQYPCLENPLP